MGRITGQNAIQVIVDLQAYNPNYVTLRSNQSYTTKVKVKSTYRESFCPKGELSGFPAPVAPWISLLERSEGPCKPDTVPTIYQTSQMLSISASDVT